MELHFVLVTLCVIVPVAWGQADFASLLGSLGFGGGGPMPGSGSCPYQPHPNKFKFTQVVNNRVMTQDCAPGTMFDMSKCSCVNSASAGAGPMPRSNPRRDPPPFGGPADNPLAGLLSRMSGMPGMPASSSRPAPPAPFRPVSRSNRMKPGRVTDNFAGADGSLSVDLSNIMTPNSPSAPYTYSPDSGKGFKPAVDPSMLPDVIPQEVLKMLNIPSGQGPESSPPLQTTPPTTTTTTTPTKPSAADLRAKVMSMLNKGKSPSKDKSNASSSVLPDSVLKALNMAGPAPLPPSSKPPVGAKKSVLAPDLMNMLQKSMKSPFPQTPAPTAPTSARYQYTPVTKPPRISSRRPDWFGPTRPPRTTAPRPRPQGRSRHMSTTRPGPRPSARPPSRFQDALSSFNPSPFDGNNGGNPFGGNGNSGGNPFGGNGNSGVNPFGGNGNSGGNPMEALLGMLQGGMGGMGGLEMGMGQGMGQGMGGQDPFAELMARMQPSTRPPSPGTTGAPGMDLIAALLGGAGGSSGSAGFGPGSPMDSMLRRLGGPGGSSGGPGMGGPSPFGGSGGASGLGTAATMMAGMGAAGAAPVTDMTNFFNTQGRMGIGLTHAGNINMFKLQELDRQGVIDISDLTPQGLAAANAHFSG